MDIQTIIKQPNTTLIDVREPFEFAEGYAAGAINMPLQSIPQRLEELRRLKGPIVLYCRSGNRSGMAMNYLKGQGFKEVYNGGSLTAMQYFMIPDRTNA